MKCPACASQVPETSRFCAFCGMELPTDTALTLTQADAGRPPKGPLRQGGSPSAEKLSFSGTLDNTRFIPGTMLANRYRIVALIGKGGMGEVYRAEDVKLGQAIALKLLPVTLAQDVAALARLHREVRTARQVSHPNVCRVFDIGESGGMAFLTMEYVDGEDLASLLRRIGRLPIDKALQIARELCAGLAAVHNCSVVHRDLKPANVMIDGRGKVRITDFGLASLAGDFRIDELGEGTPAYMAPEQLDGKTATVQSDLYSLGLVLYEIFTGKRAFDAATLPELRRLHQHQTPASLSHFVKDLDPLVVRAIMRCLESDSAKRPVTALQVASALPGGDPLAAALAAGETPSPEMVAASGSAEGLRPAAAWACIAAIALGAIGSVVLSSQTSLFRHVPLDKPPVLLAERAREILRKIGYAEPPADYAFGFREDDDYLRYIKEHDKSKTRWDNLERGAVEFWYRQSPRELVARWFETPEFPGGDVSPDDPALDISGMALVMVDPRGRLAGLQVVPPQVERTSGPPASTNWAVLFSEAGLDPAKWSPTEPNWTPPTYCDTRAAWTGDLPERPEFAMRIEAASYQGKPVYFQMIGPWKTPERSQVSESTTRARANLIITSVIVISLCVGGVLLARRNLRLGRSDRRGAFRLAIFILAVTTLAWLCNASHVPTLGELVLFITFASRALFLAGLFWVLYLGLEPYIRRRWPITLISWSRLLAGGVRDPLVGRDILIGYVAGSVNLFLESLAQFIPTWLGSPFPEPSNFSARAFLGFRGFTADILSDVILVIFDGLAILFLLFLFRSILRRQWASVGAFILIVTIVRVLAHPLWLEAVLGVLAFSVVVFLLIRFGLLAVIAMLHIEDTLQTFPITLHASAWYAGIGFAALAILAAVASYAFYISLAGRPMFGRVAFESDP